VKLRPDVQQIRPAQDARLLIQVGLLTAAAA